MRALLMICLLGLSITAVAGTTLYVQSDKAALSASPAFDAPQLATLTKGDELAVIEKQADWYRVRAGGKTGWIPQLLVSTHKPMSRTSILSGEENSVKTSARRRASNVTTAGAARGLANEDRRRANGEETADYAAVKSMESDDIPQKYIDAFGRTLSP